MKVNVGFADKIIRIVVGAGIIIAGYYYESWLGLLGLIPLITASFGYCGLYTILGISTVCKKDKVD